VVPGSILFFGSLCEKKGVRQLIEAFPAILEGFPNATLTLAGRDTATSPSGGSFLEHALRHVDPVARRRIGWLGHVPNTDIDALIERSHVCVLPSLLESFGLAWLEVMSMGRPLVASTVGPSREIIDDGTDGLLCDPHDPRSIAEATLALLRDDVLAERVGRNARESSDRFALEPIVRRNLRLYDDAISSFGPSLEREVGRCMKQVGLALRLLAQHRR
jgi:glycosyltransferase involved in cell wall biosynthesis